MKRRLLPLSAIVCATLIAFLLFGYGRYFGVSHGTFLPGNIGVARQVSLTDGRIIFIVVHAIPSGSLIHWNWFYGNTGLHPANWFTSFSDASGPIARGSTIRIIQFPLWCLILPLSIPPILWLARRRKPDAPRFQVVFDENPTKGDKS